MSFGSSQWRPWVLDEAPARDIVRRAADLGINFLDTADMYSAGESETLTGKWVREFFRRDEVVVATKARYPVDIGFKSAGIGAPQPPRPRNTEGLSRKRLFHAVDASLKRLGTDYIDLYQIHRLDPATPIEETMEALHDIVKSGRVRYIGASSMFAWQFAKAQQIARENHWTGFVSMQNHYNLIYREEEREMIPLCRDQGVALMPWSPLARGFLAGNRGTGGGAAAGETQRARTDDIAQHYYCGRSDGAVLEALTALAKGKQVSNATLAYAWLLHKGVTAPIVGASKVWQIEEAVAALQVQLSPQEAGLLEAKYEAHPVIGHA
jgi:aryl-alcohol dehydrogenase-like predicted oxidoreductase